MEILVPSGDKKEREGGIVLPLFVVVGWIWIFLKMLG
jgi:hypothetical protein